MFRATAAVVLCLTALSPASADAQDDPVTTHEGEVAEAQAEKARALHPYRAPWLERVIQEVEEHLTDRDLRWHPYYGHAYPGAGIAVGLGYLFRPGDYETLDVRAARSMNRSTRAEVVFRAPHLAERRLSLVATGGRAEGFEQSFYGVPSRHGDSDERSYFDFRRAYGSVQIETRARRAMPVFGAGVGVLHYEHRLDPGSAFAQRFSAPSLPGLGATVTYAQAQASAGFDWRPQRGYARRGGAVMVTARRSVDTAGDFTFSQVDYDVVQHVPVLRDAWVLSLHGRAETTFAPYKHEVPFFMLPALGNGTTLRGYANQRFRDRNSMLLSAEWRVLVNAVLDAAIFYDAGKVTARPSQFSRRHLESDYGVGLRFHSASTTPIRIDVARSREGLRVMFGAVAAF